MNNKITITDETGVQLRNSSRVYWKGTFAQYKAQIDYRGDDFPKKEIDGLSTVGHFDISTGLMLELQDKSHLDLTTIRRKTFLDLIAAAESARAWMATQAPANDWSNQVRHNLNNALSMAIQEKSQAGQCIDRSIEA